jgi:hypothetical protein
MALLSLVAKLGLDTTGFQQGINKAGKQASQFGSQLKNQLASAFSVAAVTAFARDLAQTVNRIKDLSEQFGVTTDEVQRIDFALKQSGLAFEDFGMAITKMGGARKEAVENAGDLREAFERYGLTLDKLNSPLRSNSSLVIELANNMAKGGISTKEQADMVEMFGTKASKLATVLANLQDVEVPAMFSNEDIERVDKLTKSLEALSLQLKVIAATTFGGAIDTFTKAIQSVTTKNKSPLERAAALSDMAVMLSNPFAAVAKNLLGIGGNKAGQANQAQDVKKVLDQANQMNGQGLFEVDKNKKEEKLQAMAPAAGRPLQAADQLGRIGAFSGGASQSVYQEIRKNTSTLQQIQRVLEVRGIVVRDL